MASSLRAARPFSKARASLFSLAITLCSLAPACSLGFDSDGLDGVGQGGGSAGAGGNERGGEAGAAGATGASASAGSAGSAGAAGGAGASAAGAGGAAPRCGDGRLDAGEECDDGEAVNGPAFACSSDCKVACEGGAFGADSTAKKDAASNHCYVHVQTSVGFDEAALACRRLPFAGFRLASLRTLNEFAFAQGLLPNSGPSPTSWVGLYDSTPDDKLESWQWDDESPPDFAEPESFFWSDGEPDDKGNTPKVEDGEEECVLITKTTLKLADAPCNFAAGYLCEYSPSPL